MSDTNTTTNTNSSSSMVVNQKWILKQHPVGDFDSQRDAVLIREEINLGLTQFITAAVETTTATATATATTTTATSQEEEDVANANGNANVDTANQTVTVTVTEQHHQHQQENPGYLSIAKDEVIVATQAYSVDAFLRTMLDQDAFHGTVKPDKPLIAIGIGTVITAGATSTFKVGARVTGIMPVATYAVCQSSELNSAMVLFGKPSLSLGLLGVSGLTAYTGMFLACPKGPNKGDTVVVSAAAGAVGCVAAQLAKLQGARVVGIAGGPKKCQFLLDTLKLDAAVDYKDTSTSLADQLDKACPDGIDFYFDNVGGSTLDVVLSKLNQGARVVICGAISQYSNGDINSKNVQGPANYIQLATKNASMTGFTFDRFLISALLRGLPYLSYNYYMGRIHLPEHVEPGVESFGRALEMLFTGGHIGRLLIDVDGKLTSK
jgi:NADPH-dependent curcumin reductase CurA